MIPYIPFIEIARSYIQSKEWIVVAWSFNVNGKIYAEKMFLKATGFYPDLAFDKKDFYNGFTYPEPDKIYDDDSAIIEEIARICNWKKFVNLQENLKNQDFNEGYFEPKILP